LIFHFKQIWHEMIEIVIKWTFLYKNGPVLLWNSKAIIVIKSNDNLYFIETFIFE